MNKERTLEELLQIIDNIDNTSKDDSIRVKNSLTTNERELLYKYLGRISEELSSERKQQEEVKLKYYHCRREYSEYIRNNIDIIPESIYTIVDIESHIDVLEKNKRDYICNLMTGEVREFKCSSDLELYRKCKNHDLMSNVELLELIRKINEIK